MHGRPLSRGVSAGNLWRFRRHRRYGVVTVTLSSSGLTVTAHVVSTGVTTKQYDQVLDEVGWPQRPPAGGIYHVTWWEDGACHNVDAWDGEQAFKQLRHETSRS